jgi:hypothetical protein
LPIIIWFFIGYWILNGAEFLFWPLYINLQDHITKPKNRTLMSTNPSNTQTEIASRKTVIVDGEKNIEFEFSRINRFKEYDDIVIQIHNQEFEQRYGKVNNPLFIRDNTLYSYYKTNDEEYIKIVNAIGSFIARVYDLQVKHILDSYR